MGTTTGCASFIIIDKGTVTFSNAGSTEPCSGYDRHSERNTVDNQTESERRE